MAKLFESTWKDGFDYYERYYDDSVKKSFKRKVTTPFEWFEPQSNGIYSYILDSSLKLTKIQSHNPKEGRDKFGFLDPMYRNIRDNYWNKDLYNLKPRTWYLDIETRSGINSTGFPVPEKALEEVCLIQIFDSELNQVIMLGTKDWKFKEKYDLEYETKYIVCKDEIHLFETYFAIFAKLDPLFIYAWNGLGFDYPYLFNRARNLGLDTNKLSNYGKTDLKMSEFQGRIEFKFNAPGHFYIDMMEVYRKFILAPRDSYSLENISNIELDESKVDHSEYPTFDDFYLGNYSIPDDATEEQKNSEIYKAALAGDIELMKELGHSEFCFYGYKDPILIKRLDDKLNFTSLMNMIAEKMGVQVSDTLGTVKSWSQYLLNVAMLDNKIMPIKQDFPDPHVVGGFVKDPITGKIKWVMSADVNSMYPLLGMVGFNMSPETFVPKHKLSPELREIVLRLFNNQNESERFNITDEEFKYVKSILKRDNVTLGINGAVFRKDELGIIPRLVQEIYNSRKQAKKVMFKYEVRKVLIKDIIKHYDTNTYNADIQTKEVLEYTEDELRGLELNKLHELEKEASNGELLWNTKQMTEKILMNALYGALANKYFPLFNEEMAAAITGNGRYFIQKKSNYIEAKLQSLIPSEKPYIIYNDTDAAYYHIEPFMAKYQEQNPNLSIDEYVDWADEFEKKIIQPVIQASIDDFAEELNAYNKEVIGSEREIIADAAIFSAKKKYIARVRDSEGTRYPENDPKIKVMGFEIIKSSTPKWSKKYLKSAIPLILDKSEIELKQWIKEIKSNYVKVPIYEISGVSSISNVTYNPSDTDVNGRPKALTAGTKSAMSYNNYITNNGLTGRYQKISSGDKAKKIFLRTPNKFNSNLIAFNSDNFCKEISDVIDYDVNFEKTFLNSLQLMVASLKWNVFKETAPLDDW